MSENSQEEQWKSLASQLSCPSGEHGLKTAENMAINNKGMIQAAMDALGLKDGESVLEIGPGGGRHLQHFFEYAAGLTYTGVDISDLMVAEASKFNESWVSEGKAKFLLSDGERLDFSTGYFDKIFTINTIYFWNDPKQYLLEIKRVLKPEGIFSLCFAAKEFMVRLPFTNYVFKLYTLEEVHALLAEAGFGSIESTVHNEIVISNANEKVERDFIVMTASRQALK